MGPTTTMLLFIALLFTYFIPYKDGTILLIKPFSQSVCLVLNVSENQYALTVPITQNCLYTLDWDIVCLSMIGRLLI